MGINKNEIHLKEVILKRYNNLQMMIKMMIKMMIDC
jgi:hypothetical protein